MWRSNPALRDIDARVVLIAFEDEERAHMFLEDMPFDWPLAIDAGRELYAAFGFSRASTRGAWLSLRTVAFYARSALRGRIPRRPTGDTLQLGGDVVVDSAGIVRYIHASAEPADRPAVYELLGSLAAVGEEPCA